MQYPLTDVRKYISHSIDLLPRPNWPSPAPYSDFVRYFGGVRHRGKGGVTGWVGENEICDAHNALRLMSNILPYQHDLGLIRIRCVARHLYFNGQGVGKHEMVFLTKSRHILFTRAKETNEFFGHILQTPASIRLPDETVIKGNLYSIRKHLANLFLYASSERKEFHKLKNKDWIYAGEPLILCELEKTERMNLGVGVKGQKYEKIGITVYQKWISFGNTRVRLLVFQLDDTSIETRQKARLLRICLMRLHAEFESIRHISELLDGKVIVPVRGTDQSEALQLYLNRTATNIFRARDKARKIDESADLLSLVLSMSDVLNPGQREAFFENLRRYEIRVQLINKWQKVFADQIFEGTTKMIRKLYPIFERAVGLISTVFFIGFVCYLVFRNEPFRDANLVVLLRIIMAFLLPIMGATIPGMLNVKFDKFGFTIRAVGAVGMFIIAIFFTPQVLPTVISTPTPTVVQTATPIITPTALQNP